jgi:hypothetical protein
VAVEGAAAKRAVLTPGLLKEVQGVMTPGTIALATEHLEAPTPPAEAEVASAEAASAEAEASK